MMLLLDAGNTRIKLAWVSGDVWSSVDELPSRQADELPQYFAGLPDIQEVWVCNVAGDELARHIRAACDARGWKPRFITSRSVQCGVSNGYTQPEQLGCDRWAALLAAWHLVRGACLVVNCGTATTIDALSGLGEFVGGLILPGVELMQRSLSEATAQLGMAQGGYQPFPRDTAAAIFSGAIQASCGAIARQHVLLGDAAAPVLLSGGAAGLLQPHLKLPLRATDNLVLQGLWLIAQETKT